MAPDTTFPTLELERGATVAAWFVEKSLHKNSNPYALSTPRSVAMLGLGEIDETRRKPAQMLTWTSSYRSIVLYDQSNFKEIPKSLHLDCSKFK